MKIPKDTIRWYRGNCEQALDYLYEIQDSNQFSLLPEELQDLISLAIDEIRQIQYDIEENQGIRGYE